MTTDEELVRKCLLYGVTQQDAPGLFEMYARLIKESTITQEQIQKAMQLAPFADWQLLLKMLAIKLNINYSYLVDKNGQIIGKYIND